MMKYIRHPYAFAILCVVLFCLACGINWYLAVPAIGVARIYAFAPFVLVWLIKIYTMIKD